jgi:hypothetical protein
MDDPPNLTLFRDYEIGARVIPCHRRTTASQNSDQPQAHRLRPLLTVGHVAGEHAGVTTGECVYRWASELG